MPISVDELTPTDTPAATDPGAQEVQIVAWAEELPRNRRTSPFDSLVEELRSHGDTARYAKLHWTTKPISPNKVNQLRKRYPDVEFVQVTESGERQTWARYRGPS